MVLVSAVDFFVDVVVDADVVSVVYFVAAAAAAEAAWQRRLY